MRMIRVVMMALTLPLLLIYGTTTASAQATNVNFGQAYALAQAKAPKGQLVKARQEKNNTIFGFYFLVKNKLTEIEISATGKVVKINDGTDPIPQDVQTMLQQNKGKAKMPVGRLMELSSEALNGIQPTSVAYAVVGKKLVFKADDVVLDARTGEVVSKGKKK